VGLPYGEGTPSLPPRGRSAPLGSDGGNGWGTYERHGDAAPHAGGKAPRQRIERVSMTWRTRIPRCVHRTICCAPTERMHDRVIGPFINGYACRVVYPNSADNSCQLQSR
jgi:hypothetical protein